MEPARWPQLDPSRCEPCGKCEVACVEARTGLLNLHQYDTIVLEQRRLRIRVVAGLPSLDVCVHCVERPCAPVCPHHALVVFPNGRVDLVESRCTGCGYCIAACEYGAIRRATTINIAVKCDGCAPLGHAPACVSACPSAALSVVVR